MNNCELKHYGILGMKWGVRRQRGPDGRVIKKRQMSEEAKTAKTLKKKRVYEMSNQELRQINERMNLERQYKDLKKKDISAGQKIVKSGLKTFGADPIKEIIKEAEKSAIRSALGMDFEKKAK